MPDLIEELYLPSGGSEQLYGKKLTAEYRIRAPRLSEKGIGDLSKKNKIQADVLYKCLDPTPEIHPYDWHTGDFTAANLKQRLAAKGSIMGLMIKCPHPKCRHVEKIEVNLNEVEMVKPNLPLDLKYTTAQGEEVELRFFTPRIFDDIKSNTKRFKEDFPEADYDVSLQETVRALVVSINGEKLSYSQMTNWICRSYEVDLIAMVDKASVIFGPKLIRTMECPECGRTIVYSISPDND